MPNLHAQPETVSRTETLRGGDHEPTIYNDVTDTTGLIEFVLNKNTNQKAVIDPPTKPHWTPEEEETLECSDTIITYHYPVIESGTHASEAFVVKFSGTISACEGGGEGGSGDPETFTYTLKQEDGIWIDPDSQITGVDNWVKLVARDQITNEEVAVQWSVEGDSEGNEDPLSSGDVKLSDEEDGDALTLPDDFTDGWTDATLDTVWFTAEVPDSYTISARRHTYDNGSELTTQAEAKVDVIDIRFSRPDDDGSDSAYVVFANHIDADDDGVPDYADMSIDITGIKKPLELEVIGENLDWNEVTFTFDYEGTDSAAAEPIEHNGEPTEFMDFRPQKGEGTLRLWRDSEEEEGHSVIEHIHPGVEYNAATDLDFTGEATFHVEGLREGEDTISVTMTIESEPEYEGNSDEDVEVFEPTLAMNNSNDSPDKRPGVPSVEFHIGEEDLLIKDQGDGFAWWWSDGEAVASKKGEASDLDASDLNAQTIIDLAPLKIHIPEGLEDLTFYIESTDINLELHKAVSPGSNRRAFLQSHEIGGDQLDEDAIALNAGNKIELEELEVGDNEFVFRALGSGEEQGQIRLHVEDPDSEQLVPVATARLTVRDPEYYWAFYSARNSIQEYTNYPVENGTVDFEWYGTARNVSANTNAIDPERSHYLIFVHGYNNNKAAAKRNFNEWYRRTFWMGYRGNVIGFAWKGDNGWFWQFDPDVQAAFRTAPTFRKFLREEVMSMAGNASNIDVMAHSLGNLMVSETLRLERHYEGAQSSLIRNYLSIQAAIFREAFEERSDMEYREVGGEAGTPIYPAETEEDEIVYSIDQQMQHTWRFWFNQPGAVITDVLAGNLYNSYNRKDQALYDKNSMRHNCHYWRAAYDGRRWHYYRDSDDLGLDVYRAPNGDSSFRNRIPAILEERTQGEIDELYDEDEPIYSRTDLNLAIGSVVNLFAQFNINASEPQFGWSEDGHSDDRVISIVNGEIEMWFPRIWGWYEEVFDDQEFIPLRKE